MRVKITPFIPYGEITAPPSKSVAHRLLISAGLKKGKTLVKNIGESLDVKATLSCLEKLGAKVTVLNGDALIEGFKNPNKGEVLNCNESGSTLRFLMPIACALGANCTFTGSEKLLSRPSVALIDQLSKHGISVDGYSLKGQLLGGKFDIDASVSSQYITGLLFALPLLERDSQINLIGEIVSKDYINITLSVLDLSGIKYQMSGNSIFIKGNQQFNLPNEVTVEGDWSGSAFPLVLGTKRGQVTVKGLNCDSMQGDKKILDILKSAGAIVTQSENSVTVKGGNLTAFDENFENIPDLAPICAMLSALADGKSTLSGISRLKIKESDRVLTTLKVLLTAGITASENDGEIIIFGGKVQCGVYNGENDHRIVMASAVLSAYGDGDSVINGAEAIEKSYPKFFEDLKALGGVVEIGI